MAFADNLYNTIKGLGKISLLSRPAGRLRRRVHGGRIIVMGNGPSLADTIAEHLDALTGSTTMAVNFAAISPDFFRIRPAYYVMADPHFFADSDEGNLGTLRQRLAEVDWPMTILVPAPMLRRARKLYGGLTIEGFNAVGIEGFPAVSHLAFSARLAMPRPRNVLIPSIMLAIMLGYDEIVIVGADHSWMSSISVTDDNEVVSIQPHFYKDDEKETSRIRHEYRNYRLHDIVDSFAVAFRAYHHIAAYAATRGIKIYNATPGSYIDAFPRRSL